MRVYIITTSEPFEDGVQIIKVYTEFKQVSEFLRGCSDDFDNLRLQVWLDGKLKEYYCYEHEVLELLWEGE